ncbi:hypothetical protein [Dactylosporangium sp. NPDC048998]|uniref:hypothetical protein n=1 Tax=Dactylosporangium sp. NPDC048998 TaxID=3363976 RepID=UPI003714BE35
MAFRNFVGVRVARRRGSIIAAVALGLLAFAADYVDGAAGQVLTALTSSGFAWGLAAFLAGRSAVSPKRAAADATALLVVATLLYYLLVLVVSRRWSGGVLEDGTPADLYGLRSVALMTALWLIGSLVAGPVLGLLGHTARAGGPSRAAAAAGVACGLLSGEGWCAVMTTQLWHLLTTPDLQHDAFFVGVAIGNLFKIVLPLAVLAWLATTHRLWRAWPTLLIATAASGTLTALAWYLLNTATNRL